MRSHKKLEIQYPCFVSSDIFLHKLSESQVFWQVGAATAAVGRKSSQTKVWHLISHARKKAQVYIVSSKKSCKVYQISRAFLGVLGSRRSTEMPKGKDWIKPCQYVARPPKTWLVRS